MLKPSINILSLKGLKHLNQVAGSVSCHIEVTLLKLARNLGVIVPFLTLARNEKAIGPAWLTFALQEIFCSCHRQLKQHCLLQFTFGNEFIGYRLKPGKSKRPSI